MNIYQNPAIESIARLAVQHLQASSKDIRKGEIENEPTKTKKEVLELFKMSK